MIRQMHNNYAMPRPHTNTHTHASKHSYTRARHASDGCVPVAPCPRDADGAKGVQGNHGPVGPVLLTAHVRHHQL